MSPRSPARSLAEALLRDQVVAAGRRLGARGLISAAEGNISVRLGDGTILITPAGHRKDELGPADLVVVPIHVGKGAPSGAAGGLTAQPSSDVTIHRAVYGSRPDVVTVVHAHLPAALALTLAGEIPDPAALPETAMLLPRLPYVPFAAPGSSELATAVGRALAEGPEPLPSAVLLERHGAVAVGATVDQAVDRLELVELLCRTWRDALQLRGAVALTSGRAILRS
jgi:L-fuculose-phosphate aldolase